MHTTFNNKTSSNKCIGCYDFQISQCLSDLGGVIGIWIGMSAISLGEVIQLLFDICLILLGRDSVDLPEEEEEEEDEEGIKMLCLF